MPLPEHTKLGRYQILSPLGAGAMGEVYRARDSQLERDVAIKGKRENVRKIGALLNVRAVLEGSVRKAGNRLRIAAQLVNAEDGLHLWSETFNREMADVFAIQEEISRNIVKALRGILTDSDKEVIVRAMPADVRAYESYLRGRQYFHQFSRKGFDSANQMFRRAIAVDPAYALAYAGLADGHSLLYTYWDPTPANLDQADAASRKALELDPKLPEGHVARGLALTLKKSYQEAEREFRAAVALSLRLFSRRQDRGCNPVSQGSGETRLRTRRMDRARWRSKHHPRRSGLRPDYAGVRFQGDTLVSGHL